MPRTRAEKRHDEAIEEHERAWNQMHKIGVEQGRDHEDWRAARTHTVEAARQVRLASHARKLGH